MFASYDAMVHYEWVDIEDDSPFRDQFMKVINNETSVTEGENVTAAYVYQGTADKDADHAAVRLAFVPTGAGDQSDPFTNYSYGAIYKRVIADWIRTDPIVAGEETSDNTEDDVYAIQAINYYLDEETIDDESTDEEIFTALEDARDAMIAAGSYDGGLDGIVFIVEVVNPGYFDQDGFVGTESYNKPDWATEITTGFSSNTPVSAAEIAQNSFLFVMPGDEAPLF